jgi:superfamily I DNA/RNA helicase
MFQAPEAREVPPDTEEAEEDSPIAEGIIFNAAIRLVRGVAGSGKTLVLVQRAQYLAAQHPEWRIGVLTYNSELARMLRANLKGIAPIKRVSTFHKLCAGLLKGYIDWRDPQDCEGWLRNRAEGWPVMQDLDVDFVNAEIRWIKEMAIPDRGAYLACERKGRVRALHKAGREAVYEVLDAYQDWLQAEKAYDWADVPHLVLQGMDEGQIKTGEYDAILVDEAQDFAPVWIEVIKRLLKPDGGLLFLVDDPSQSIFRYYSWREKGVPVVGRTRWLRIPYRNTREIYQAAYEVIRDDEALQRQLEERVDVAVTEPDLASQHLRSGPRPELRRFPSVQTEFSFIRGEIERLLQGGLSSEQIVVLHRRRSGERRLKRHLRGLGVKVSTFHALKGLEYETVFLSQMQDTFQGFDEATDDQLSDERRLVYMAMTRAREHLYLNYEGRWPAPIGGVLDHVDQALT